MADGSGLVQTLDFLTPLVNDPYHFGRIAASNALSDVYAMGGTPLAAMNIVCFPVKKYDQSVLREILRGGLDVVRESGAVPAGGHSVEDDEIKYGLAVSGIVDPGAMATNAGVRPGDALVLTKPIGTGVLATAIKADWDGWEGMEADIARWSGRLNEAGGRAIREFGLRAATDVTGFGLMGHLLELAEASGVGMELELSAVPLHERALELAGMGLLPAGSICNRNHYLPKVRLPEGADPVHTDLLFDAQTAGGLVLAVPQDHVADVRDLLLKAGDMAAVIGRAAEYGGDQRIAVR